MLLSNVDTSAQGPVIGVFWRGGRHVQISSGGPIFPLPIAGLLERACSAQLSKDFNVDMFRRQGAVSPGVCRSRHRGFGRRARVWAAPCDQRRLPARGECLPVHVGVGDGDPHSVAHRYDRLRFEQARTAASARRVVMAADLCCTAQWRVRGGYDTCTHRGGVAPSAG